MLTNITLNPWTLHSCCALHLNSIGLTALLTIWTKALKFIAQFLVLYMLFTSFRSKLKSGLFKFACMLTHLSLFCSFPDLLLLDFDSTAAIGNRILDYNHLLILWNNHRLMPCALLKSLDLIADVIVPEVWQVPLCKNDAHIAK